MAAQVAVDIRLPARQLVVPDLVYPESQVGVQGVAPLVMEAEQEPMPPSAGGE